MKRISGVIWPIVVCLTGCVGIRGTTTRSPERIVYGGFSIERQEDPRWRVNRDEQSYYRAVAKLDLRSSTHSFLASVTLSAVGGDPKSQEDLKELVRSSFVAGDTNRYALLDLEVNIRTNRGLTGVMYTQRALDRKPIGSSAPLMIIQHGYVTRYPYDPNIILEAMYLERGRKEAVGQPELTRLGEAFLNGVRFERLR